MNRGLAYAAPLALYALVVALGVSTHAPWFDEAQAWLLARDVSPWRLYAVELRYEGTPGLWHTMLMLPAKLGLPYRTMSWIAAAGALLGAHVWLRWSPLPLVPRLLAPFGFFFAFQYAVVARSYCWLAVFAFLAARELRPALERPARFAGALAGLTLLSIHGALLAGGLYAAHLFELWRLRRFTRAHALATVAVLGAALLAFLQVRLPRDLSGPFNVLHRLDADAARRSWSMIDGALFEQPLASAALLAIACAWLWRRRALHALLYPLALLALFFGFAYSNVWHQGIVWLALLCAVWIGFQGASARDAADRAFAAALSLALAVHVGWTALTYREALRKPYSAGAAAAQHLIERCPKACAVAGIGFGAFALQPYFPSNRFANVNGGAPPAHYFWSVRADRREDAGWIAAHQPDFIAHSLKFSPPLELAGFRRSAVFAGDLWWKGRSLETDAIELLERAR